MIVLYILYLKLEMKIRLSEQEKIKILLLKETNSYQCIADILMKPKSTVYYFLKRYELTQSITNKKPKGRINKISRRIVKKVITFIKRNPQTTLRKIICQFNLGVHYTTLAKYLKKEKIRNYNVLKKPKFSGVNKLKRLEFASKFYNKSHSYWNKFVCADASSFILNTIYKSKCWRRTGSVVINERSRNYSLKYVKFWGFITPDGIGKLVKIDGRFNSQSYCKMLKTYFLEEGYHRRYKIIQDLDTVHYSSYSRRFMNANNIQVLKEFPPQGCELNLIENVWYYLKKKVFSKPEPRSLSELEIKVNNEWNKIPKEFLKSLYLSMPKRLELMIQSRGNPIKY